MIQGSIQAEDIAVVNIHVSNIVEPKYIKQIWMDIKGETNSNTIIVGDFNTSLTLMDRSSRQKINNETLTLNNTLDQIDFIYVYINIPPQSNRIHILFKWAWPFSRIDYMLDHKTSHSRFKNEIISSIFSDHMLWD